MEDQKKQNQLTEEQKINTNGEIKRRITVKESLGHILKFFKEKSVPVVLEFVTETTRDIYCSVIKLFRADPVETLHACLPQVYSEINWKTTLQFILNIIACIHAKEFNYLIVKRLWFSFPDAIIEFAGKKYCPAFGNEERCERAHYASYESGVCLFLMGLIHYFACIRGGQLSRKTAHKIAMLKTVLALCECVRWRKIWVLVWWSIQDTGAWWEAETDDHPAIMVAWIAMKNFFILTALAYMNFMDMIKKQKEKIEWGEDL